MQYYVVQWKKLPHGKQQTIDRLHFTTSFTDTLLKIVLVTKIQKSNTINIEVQPKSKKMNDQDRCEHYFYYSQIYHI